MEPTICEMTECPEDETLCPEMETLCPDAETVCPEFSTICPEIETECPDFPTFCPEKETECPATDTQCPEEPTWCPETETECPEFSTFCPETKTQCPPTETRCPRIQTLCPRFLPTYCPLIFLACDICPLGRLFGEKSEEAELMRHIRDNILNETPEGRAIIKLYYEWSPYLGEVLEKDEAFKQEVKEIIEGILLFFREEVE
jgi:hypothetical protein